MRRAWAHGLWSVEVKQPELQVARDYTPLPPPLPPARPSSVGVGEGGDEGAEVQVAAAGGEEEEAESAVLRLYVRKLERGEVSGYLARLKVGDTLELRGPRLGFDLRRRVGVDGDEDGGAIQGNGDGVEEASRDKKKVVFLAGGTGIAPALQAARALLDKPEVEMEVVWANRRREDCVGCEGDGEKQGPVMAMLEDFRKKYGERFKYSCTVDEEGSYIDAGAVVRAAGELAPAPTPGQPSWGFWSAGGTPQKSGAAVPLARPVTDASACHYHSPRRLVSSDERDLPADTDREPCRCKDIDGNPVRGGKNLLMVSGPEGFIAHFTGPKVWRDGKELQAPVGGVIGELKRKYPDLGENWLVLKM